MSHVKKFQKIDYLWTEGDTKPLIGFTLPNNRQVVDEIVKLRLEQPDGTIVTIAASDLGGPNGQFEWGADDLVAGANQRVQIKSTDIAALVQTTETFLIDVQGKLA